MPLIILFWQKYICIIKIITLKTIISVYIYDWLQDIIMFFYKPKKNTNNWMTIAYYLTPNI